MRHKQRKRHHWLWKTLLGLFLLAGGGYWLWWQIGSRPIHARTYRNTHVVTVFVPGYASNSLTFGPMVSRFQKDRATNQVTTINVSATGKRTVTGAKRYDGKNPLINVVFADAKSPIKETQQLTALLHWLRTEHRVTKINLVGHSMGSNLSFRYLTTKHTDAQPQVIKYVLLASEFYRDPATQLAQFPKSVKTLIIGGQIFGAKGDWAVSLAGVKRYEQALKTAGISTSLYIYRGTPIGAYHSSLHQNPYVDAKILQFLFA
ncbi:alpha/beta hydrolase [Lacticaseibacillus chiayiensis]|uniref:Alpha/beta fold hydrolase n=1 Tax=Lacticaseibacillus chiayiensis TaxID=2100821 RepID=A0A4Q1U1M8_9LACO|nr:alpha/beta fold hydrolase [Lacticaseibacillus chiayiensis]QVI35225.1 alpha/beta fold hydrolase [Lacticaseibacillus chiayiensis]RXT24595.1 alpha/beta hydrolase [Lacticaseibacillus chiayiensis]UYN57006.1 alpha/beta fold hydrolase [Lacticaseibacillus chiayiensis]